MKSSINLTARHKALQLVLLQGVFALVFSALSALWFGKAVAVAGIMGGVICVLPNVCFALIAFRYAGASAAKQIVSAFYWAEAMKLVCTAALFAGVFYWGHFAPLPLLIGYMSAQCGFWLAPIVFKAPLKKS